MKELKENFLITIQEDDFLSILHEKHGDRFKKYRDNWGNAEKLEFVPDYPLELALEINNYCNLACKMCLCSKYVHQRNNKKNMPLRYVDNILEQSKDKLSALAIGNSAEPSLHPQFSEILKKTTKAGIIHVIFGTNGLTLSDSIIDLVIESQTSVLAVSIDAATENVYKIIRGGSLSKVENNIHKLINAKEKANSKLPYLRVSFVVQEENKNEVDLFKNKWVGLADRVDFQDLVVFTEDINTNNDIAFQCSQPFKRMVIDYNGDVFPCCHYYKKELKLGNLRDHSIEELWNGEIINKLRESIKNRDYYSTCFKCLQGFSNSI